ncbi:MAG TPA: histidine phosphatase family protein, partial [Candidatus Limnocylindria bacterium]|nr:histidine phosphatase family protein [Candidatus Limnocylindria bacterium]
MGSLFLIRHSITAASATGRNLGSADDPPLASEGVVAAGQLAEALVLELDELPHDEVRLISSPARRCRETM